MVEDKFIRFTKLYALILLTIIGAAAIIAGIFWTFYGFAKIVDKGPVDTIFGFFTLLIPVAILLSAFIIFAFRTRKHPVAIVRYISWIIFAIGICYCITWLVLDFHTFFFHKTVDVYEQDIFSIGFLGGNIVALMFIAILQALTMPKEKDWMDRER